MTRCAPRKLCWKVRNSMVPNVPFHNFGRGGVGCAPPCIQQAASVSTLPVEIQVMQLSCQCMKSQHEFQQHAWNSQGQSYRERTHDGYACVEHSMAEVIKQRAGHHHKGHANSSYGTAAWHYSSCDKSCRFLSPPVLLRAGGLWFGQISS
eukprot:357218-Chlamydomonas_euryale.AAC.19